jgi:hypothetical protein
MKEPIQLGRLFFIVAFLYCYVIMSAMKAFLNYEYMITPGILKILSYIGVVIAVIVGLFTATQADVVGGLTIAIGGPIVIRIYAELMLVIFEIHKCAKQIANK